MTKKPTVEEKLAAAKARGKKAVVKKATLEQQLMLPLWPEQIRGVPNAVLRGALYCEQRARDAQTAHARCCGGRHRDKHQG